MFGVPSKFSLLSRSILKHTSSQNLLKTIGTRQYLQKPFSMLQRTDEHNSHCQFSTSMHLQTILSSKEPNIKIKEESLTEYLFPRFDSFGNKTALVDFLTGRSFSYAELKESIIKTASALNKLGYKKDDIIAVFATNCPEYAIIMLACAACGIAMTSANTSYTSSELCRHLTHSGPCALFVHQTFVKTAKEAIEKDGSLRTTIKDIIVIGEADGCRPFSRLLEDDGKSFPENVEINPVDDTAVMPYSSGTTGLPKGVMSTHMNLVSVLQLFSTLLRVTPEDTGLGILPFYHCYGMIVVMIGILQDGGKLVTLPKFDPEAYLTAIMTHKVTQLHIVPPIILFMARHPMVSKFDLSSLKRVVSGSAPMGESITTKFIDRLKAPVTQAFGMTETTTIVTIDTMPHTPCSSGIIIPNTQAKVVCTETGKALEIGSTGELCFKGPQIMKGYYKNEKATKEMIRDGWLHTGDIGHVDDNGHFYVTERIKDLIKFKANQNVAPYKKLRGGVVFIEVVPKSPSGKILRKILRD